VARDVQGIGVAASWTAVWPRRSRRRGHRACAILILVSAVGSPLVLSADDRPYSSTLARIHHEGFGFHADACAPGILALLEPLRGGLVVEVGCGSGLLTRHLTDAGHRVVATDASPAMLEIARRYAPAAIDHLLVALPGDPLPEADAVVSTGHALSYLDSTERLETALRACASAVRPGGLLALDLEDVSLLDAPSSWVRRGFLGDDWALVTDHASDGPNHYARLMTVFVQEPSGLYRKEFERHDNVLIDVAGAVGPLLVAEGLDVDIGVSFGSETNMAGLMVVKATRKPHG
jgi:SAM-dependent methyltransferase